MKLSLHCIKTLNNDLSIEKMPKTIFEKRLVLIQIRNQKLKKLHNCYEGRTRLMGFNEKYLIKVSKKKGECEAPWIGQEYISPCDQESNVKHLG